jgi:hypothetical protein
LTHAAALRSVIVSSATSSASVARSSSRFQTFSVGVLTSNFRSGETRSERRPSWSSRLAISSISSRF